MGKAWKNVREDIIDLITSPRAYLSPEELGAAIKQVTTARYNTGQYKTAWKHYKRILNVDDSTSVHVTPATLYVYFANRIFLEGMAPNSIMDVFSHLKMAAIKCHGVVWGPDCDREKAAIIELYQKTQPADASRTRKANPLTQKALLHAIETIGVRTPAARIKAGMFMMSYLACLRGNEVLPIRYVDVDIESLSLLLFYIKDAKIRAVVPKDILDIAALPCFRTLLRRIVADKPLHVDENTPLFPFVNKAGAVVYGKQWPKHTWLRVFRGTMASFDSGMDPKRWTPHSARAGVVTDMLLVGASKDDIRRLGWTFNSEVPFTVYDRRSWLTGKDAEA
jgi:hypothetical protein